MDSLYNFINDLFKRLFGGNDNSGTNTIGVSNSNDVIISDVQFNPTITVFNSLADVTAENHFAPIKGLEYNESLANSSLERAEKNNDYLERFIFYCNLRNVIPTIRCYAFFSHLSTIRKRSEMNDYNQLILAERDLFFRMMELKFRVKLIISLDIPTILTKWYNDINPAIERITDLITNIDNICENNNIEVVIDEMNSLDGQFILHNNLYIHALHSDPINKYNITKYEIDEAVINNAISNFDKRFNYLKFSNQYAKKHMQTTSMSMFIKHTLDVRVEEWYKKKDNK